ncbi:chaperonin 10-like protein [Lipomyces chichibuensis]|uniref:chaperonin 10-like protein n=1 Tax=Lipomyces chichibuensis TaxID=1546026 RepID=UPI0033430DBB
MPSTDEFTGWLGLDAKSVEGNLVKTTFNPKVFTDDDIDIKISHCGMCASDLHTLRSGWGASLYPVVVGHEIIGTITRKGKNVTQFEIGDRVGVGAQCASCLKDDCYECTHDNEPYCTERVFTYNDTFPGTDDVAYGGYALQGRYPASFAFKIPDGLPSEIAAPMMCGGITVYSPLKRNGAGPGKTVGIVGIGGLGHFGLLFAKALGSDKVYAISRSNAKEADVLAMGAEGIIATKEPGWAKDWTRKFDLIVSTANNADMPLHDYLSILKPGGRFVQVGLPEEPIPQIQFGPLVTMNVHLLGSLLGSRSEITEMLETSAATGIKSWVQTYPMEEVNEVLKLMEAGEAKYRFVLCN